MAPRIIDSERAPILVWGELPDEGTLAQARNIANLPFAHHHVALMPDAHVGFGMPIGGVFGAVGQVVPHAVGLDIGCGVRAFKTSLKVQEVRPLLDDVLRGIMREVPQGFDWHHQSQAHRTDVFDEVPDSPVLRAEKARAERQAGTLGGGNHFIELQQDPDGFVWVMIHCGSRNVGKQVAEHYDAVARDLNKRQGSPVPSQWGLAHLDTRSAMGAEYLAAMGWCLRFAKENRRLIAESVREVLKRRFGTVSFEPDIDVHHNYASIERHFGREVVVHRKGAVHAVGTVLVPGSMGTASYVAEGLANPDSFESCSHGAGRALGRREAMRRIKREQVLRELDEIGVKLAKGKQHDVAEEAPEAYKDIESVMAGQQDLVRPLVRLTPVGVVKG